MAKFIVAGAVAWDRPIYASDPARACEANLLQRQRLHRQPTRLSAKFRADLAAAGPLPPLH